LICGEGEEIIQFQLYRQNNKPDAADDNGIFRFLEERIIFKQCADGEKYFILCVNPNIAFGLISELTMFA